MGALSLPSTRAARSRTSPGRVSERQTLPLLGLGREVLSKNAESLRNSDALMRVAVPRRRGPAGLRCLVCNLAVLLFFRSALGTFCMCEARGVSPLSACSTCRRNARCPLVKAANSPFPCLARFFFDSSSAKYCPLSLQMPKGPAGYPLVLSLLFASPYLP